MYDQEDSDESNDEQEIDDENVENGEAKDVYTPGDNDFEEYLDDVLGYYDDDDEEKDPTYKDESSQQNYKFNLERFAQELDR